MWLLHARSWSTSTCSAANRIRRAFAALALAGVLALAGCGSSDEDSPTGSASTAMKSLADGDGQKACEQLTPEAQQEVVARAPALLKSQPGLTCPQLVSAAQTIVAPFADRLEDPQFLNVNVSGDSATLTFISAGFPIQLEKRDGRWLISASTIIAAATRSAQDSPH